MTQPPTPVAVQCSPGVPELLHVLGVTIALSTCQAGKVVCFSAPDGRRLATAATLTGLEIYDPLGRRVRQWPGNVRRVDLRGLPSGSYTLRVLLADGL